MSNCNWQKFLSSVIEKDNKKFLLKLIRVSLGGVYLFAFQLYFEFKLLFDTI